MCLKIVVEAQRRKKGFTQFLELVRRLIDPLKRFEGAVDIIVQTHEADSESETGPFTDGHYNGKRPFQDVSFARYQAATIGSRFSIAPDGYIGEIRGQRLTTFISHHRAIRLRTLA